MPRYEIYKYVPEALFTPVQEPPYGVDFVTGLTTRLHPICSMNLGELVQCIHYAQFDPATQTPSVPVVRENWTYFRDATNYATHRVHEIRWFFEDGTLDNTNVKTRVKYYLTLQQKRDERYRKRKNQTSAACEAVLGYLLATGSTYEQAVATGFAYWQTLVSEVAQFENGNGQPLIDRLNTDTDPAWVPSAAPFAIAELA